MLIAKEERSCVYRELFKNGVLVTHGTSRKGKRFDRFQKEGRVVVPNWQIVNLMKSLESRNYVRKTFSWNNGYHFLTSEGTAYLREYLNIPASVVPNTYVKQDMKIEEKLAGLEQQQVVLNQQQPTLEVNQTVSDV